MHPQELMIYAPENRAQVLVKLMAVIVSSNKLRLASEGFLDVPQAAFGIIQSGAAYPTQAKCRGVPIKQFDHFFNDQSCSTVYNPCPTRRTQSKGVKHFQMVLMARRNVLFRVPHTIGNEKTQAHP